MKFDLDDGGGGEWFAFFESEIKENGDIKYHNPKKGAGRVCLRVADPDVMEKIYSQTRKREAEFVLNPKTRAMERVQYVEQTPDQERKERELIWDHAIVNWEGLLDKNDKTIPVTTENKLKLMNVPQFARFVGRCLQLISGAAADRKEELEKN